MSSPESERASLLAPNVVRLVQVMLATAAVVALAVITHAYVTRVDINYSSDTALIGLMAKSILSRGELPIFVWSVGYQGVLLEGYPTALLFHLFGVNPLVLNATPAFYTWLALGLWTMAAAKALRPTAALLGLLAAIMSTPLFYQLNMRTMPNFAETFALGSLILMFFHRVAAAATTGSQVRRRDLLLLGFVAGLGMYTFAIVAYYLAAVVLSAGVIFYRAELSRGVLAFAKSWLLPWGRLHTSRAAVRWSFGAVGIVALAALILGVATLGIKNQVEMLGRSVKWNPLVMITIGGMLLLGPRVAFELLLLMRRPGPARRIAGLVGAGFVVGYMPALYFKIVQRGVTAKKTFASGSLSDIERRFGYFVEFHRDFFHLNSDAGAWVTWPVALFYGLCILAFLGGALRAALRFIRGEQEWPATLTWALIVPTVLAVFLISRTVVDGASGRYLVFLGPVYALAVGWAVTAMWQRRPQLRLIVALGFVAILWQGFGALRRDLGVVREMPYAMILRELDARGLRYGYADYWLAYATVFMGDERVVLEPIYSNYSPHYAAPVRAEPRIAYLDFDPPRLPAVDGVIEIKGERYNVQESVKLAGAITLQVLSKSLSP